MGKVIVLPAWLSVLSLAVALFVPLGISLIADTSMDAGRAGAGRVVSSGESSGQPALSPPGYRG